MIGLSKCRSWDSGDGLLVIFVGFLTLGWGCSRRPFVSRYPAGLSGQEQRVRAALMACGGCRKKGSLERRLERIHYKMAKARGDIASWRWFLAAHPKGLFAGDAGRRLMQLRLARAERARNPWLWEWFLVRYGDTPLAKKAHRALGDLLAEELMRHPDPGKIRAYLERFPENPQRQALHGLLERLAFAKLGPHTLSSELEAFVKQFPDSPRAALVQGWMAARLRRRVLRYGSSRDVSWYLTRFGVEATKILQRQLSERNARTAMADLDLTRLQIAVRSLSDPWRARVLHFLRLARAEGSRLPALRRLSARARPFHPVGKAEALLLATTSSDVVAAMAAVNALRFAERMQVPKTLLLIAATASEPLAAGAWISLVHWADERLHPGAREILQDVATGMVAGSGTSMGRAKAMALALAQPGHCGFGRLSNRTTLVSLGACLAAGCCRSEDALVRLQKMVRRTLSWLLAQVGPGRAHSPRDAAVGAVRLRILEEFLSMVIGSRTGRLRAVASDLRRSLAVRRRSLETEVVGADKGWLLDIPFAVLERARAHERARFDAFKRLCASRDLLDKEVCRVLCDDDRWRLASVCR